MWWDGRVGETRSRPCWSGSIKSRSPSSERRSGFLKVGRFSCPASGQQVDPRVPRWKLTSISPCSSCCLRRQHKSSRKKPATDPRPRPLTRCQREPSDAQQVGRRRRPRSGGAAAFRVCSAGTGRRRVAASPTLKTELLPGSSVISRRASLTTKATIFFTAPSRPTGDAAMSRTLMIAFRLPDGEAHHPKRRDGLLGGIWPISLYRDGEFLCSKTGVHALDGALELIPLPQDAVELHRRVSPWGWARSTRQLRPRWVPREA